MNFLMHLAEFLGGAATIIAWVTVLGILFSFVAPKKLVKQTIDLKLSIAMAGIGLFCSLFTLFFLFVAPKLGLAKIELPAIFGTALSGGEAGVIQKWGGRLLVATIGVLASFLYGSLFFNRIPLFRKLGVFTKGAIYGSILFVLYAFVIFPIIGMAPGVHHSAMALPTFIGPLAGTGMETLTFFAAMVVFGLLVCGVFNQWEEA